MQESPLHKKQQSLLEIRQLQIETADGSKLVHDVSLTIDQEEMLVLAGESGSGKSLTAAAIAGLLPRGMRASGRIMLKGRNLLELASAQRRSLRGKEIGWVFQDYHGSFSPYLRMGPQLLEVLRSHIKLSRQEAKERVLIWLEKVGLPAERVYDSYPFQLSGGQRQRAAIAAALLPEPSLLLADEPTTALDVLTGERVMELMMHLQRSTGCAMLWITHDLRQVWKRANRMAVMHRGTLVETGGIGSIRTAASHPYTRELLASCPVLDVTAHLSFRLRGRRHT
ncbi:ABC transporter ATP-binding protein [Cohnella sp.]|uniref:ABC transporter ATP-binding protein n=1 Tax=Cohnella sp. TaxID=1883426 RepID=UPI003562A2E6